MSDQGGQQTEAPRSRRAAARGTFPRQPLSRVLELPKAIYQLGHGEPVRRLTVFDSLDRSPSSGTSRALIAAANTGYGLINGSTASEYLSLTEDGQEIVSTSREPNRYASIYGVLFSNDVFSDFIEHFKDRPLPIDEVAIDYLQSSHNLSAADSKNAWEVFKENIQEFGLLHDLSGRSVLVSQAVALEAVGHHQPAEAQVTGDDSEPSKEQGAGRSAAEPRIAKGITPQIVFNIQVVLPENASAEDYDNIFESIGRHLLSRSE